MKTPIYQKHWYLYFSPLPYELCLLKLKYVHSTVININRKLQEQVSQSLRTIPEQAVIK